MRTNPSKAGLQKPSFSNERKQERNFLKPGCQERKKWYNFIGIPCFLVPFWVLLNSCKSYTYIAFEVSTCNNGIY
ncbi:MAG TPA: hypothetical protein DCM26_02290 [Desulfotomaculum sp.]|jgi:hypothetical protein|nr:hypothetical protein [Desulfotomaculum sp.]